VVCGDAIQGGHVTRIVIVGDVGGHPDQLRAVAREDVRADTVVIQVGDLVDRGPDSAAVLELVGGYLGARQWIQLAGNHEAQYLPGGTRFWPHPLDEDGARLLRSWWDDGQLQVAAAVRTADGDEVLITHAGLTVEAWRLLGEPATAAEAARLLNERPDLIWLGDGFLADTVAGPLWADAGWELYEPWLRFYAAGGFVPFGQVHGHSQIARFTDRTWRCPGRVRQRASADWAARHVRVRIGGRTFTGIDPKHGRDGAPAWAPLILNGVVTGGRPSAGRHQTASW
jgi:hypothetical protein